jgi:branched-chain amino acid transport system ATP-binding protein
MTKLLEVRDLSKSFGGVKAVSNVSLQLGEAEMVAIIGPNGAGKSTCFNMLGGQLVPDTGVISLKGTSIAGLPPRAIWRLGVGRTFQVASTFGSMTVSENVQMALASLHSDTARPWSRMHDLHRAEALQLLQRVQMLEHADRSCATLAYGDVKRVEIAIALANAPSLLLMDEPTAGMAPKERFGLMELVTSVVAERSVAVLFTEHDMDVVFGYAHRIIVLDRGQIVAAGSPSDVRASPKVRQIYLGDEDPGSMERATA